MVDPLSSRPAPSRPVTRIALLVGALLIGCTDAPTGPAALTAAPSPSLEAEDLASTDGTQSKPKGNIVFVRDGYIYIMSGTGAGATQLTTVFGGSPALSPGGSQIAFVRSFNGIDDIYVLDIAGAALTRLTQNAGNNVSPAWSPSGQQIAFASSRDGDFEIYVMNADGTGVSQLTANLAHDFDPAWSPDGARMVFTTERISAGNREIFVMESNGNNPLRLTTNTLWDVSPAWSPDGTMIAFICDRVVPTPSVTNPEVCVMNADGSGMLTLTDTPTAWEDRPTWSPDGSRIAFTSDRDGDYDIYTVKPSGGRAATITRNSSSDTAPHWAR